MAALTALGDMFDIDPSRHDVVTRLAALLDRDGRAATALEILDRHRRTLTKRGLLPQPSIDVLQREILDHDHHRTTAGGQSALPGPHVERSALAATIAAAVASGATEIIGKAGTGKSYLLRQLSETLRGAGRITLNVQVDERPVQPMAAVVDLLGAFTAADETLVGRLGALDRRADAVRRLRPGAELSGGLSRQDLIEELVGLFDDLLGELDAVVLLDDAMWLDRNSAEIFGRLLMRGRTLVATTRVHLATAHGPAWASVGEVPVPPFTASEVRSFLTASANVDVSDELAQRVWNRTGGSPLLLHLLAPELFDEDAQVLPATLRYAVGKRIRELGRSAVEVLRRAALGGLHFHLEALKLVAAHVEAALGDAADEGLVDIDVEAGIGRFVHGLVVEALVHDIPAGTRVAWHDEWCDALEQVDAQPLARVDHAVAAAALDPGRALQVCLDASRALVRIMDWTTAGDVARRGVQVGRDANMADHPAALHLRGVVGTTARHLMTPGFETLLLEAATDAARHGDIELLAELTTELCRHGPTTHVGTVDERVLPLVDQALGAPLAPAVRAELCAAAAGFLTVSDQWSRGRSLYHEAWAWAQDSDDSERVARVLYGAHSGLGHPDDLGERHRAAETLLAMDSAEAQGEGHILALQVGLVTADREMVDRSIAAIRRLQPAVREPIEQAGMMQAEAAYAVIEGRFADAETLTAATIQRFAKFYPATWQAATQLALGWPVLDGLDRLDEVRPLLAALVADQPCFLTWRVLALWADVTTGHLDRAMTNADAIAANGIALFEDMAYTALLTTLARAAAALGRVDLTEAVRARLSPYAGQMSWNGLSSHGPVDAALAVCAQIAHGAAAARHHAERAAALCARLSAGHFLWPELRSLLQ